MILKKENKFKEFKHKSFFQAVNKENPGFHWKNHRKFKKGRSNLLTKILDAYYLKPKNTWRKEKDLENHILGLKYGKILIQCAKRNIYLNLSDSKNRLKLTISIGYLKAKGRARRAIFFYKKLADAFTQLVVKSKIRKIHLLISGRPNRKLIRIFSKSFKSKKKVFEIYRCTRRIKLPHNGCRPRKMRRT